MRALAGMTVGRRGPVSRSSSQRARVCALVNTNVIRPCQDAWRGRSRTGIIDLPYTHAHRQTLLLYAAEM